MNRTRTFAATLVPVLALVGCGGEYYEDVLELQAGSADTAIVNGTVDKGHPTVGKIRYGRNDICTGTLVGKRTVVTAAHCISANQTSHAFVLNGVVYPATVAKKHPSYKPEGDGGEGYHDIAYLVLKTAPNVASTPVATAAPTVGQDIVLVGYGVTGEEADDYGTKRITYNAVSSVTATKFYFLMTGRKAIGTTCYGDSGGPAFATVNGTEVLVGVTSGGESPCETGRAWDVRVDSYVTWLKQETANDVNDGTSTTTIPTTPVADKTAPKVSITSPRNGNTVGTSTVVTAAITDNVAVTRAELTVDGKLVATRTAAPWEFQVTLLPGTRAIRVYGYDAAGNKGSGYVSVTAKATKSGFGAACKTGTDCQSGLCVNNGSANVCTDSCTPGEDACPAGTSCYSTNVANLNVCA